MRPAEILRIFEAALERETLKVREFGKDVGLFVLVEVLDDIDGLVGIELLQRLGDLLGGHDLEHLVAHCFVELRQGRSVEIPAERGDKRPALLGAEELDEIGKVGRMQLEREVAQSCCVVRIKRGDDGVQELGAESALIVTQFDLACFVLHGLSDCRIESVKREGPRIPGAGIALELG